MRATSRRREAGLAAAAARPADADATASSRPWREGCEQIAALPDPIGEITDLR